MTRVEKAKATRKRNQLRRFKIAAKRLAALKDTTRLIKMKALAADTRGDANTGAVAGRMAAELGKKIVKQGSPYRPPPLPTMAELRARRAAR